MDKVSLAKLVTKCAKTSQIFGGVWSAKNFPKCKMPQEREAAGQKRSTVSVDICKLLKFQIINSSPSNKIGEHWLLLCVIDNGTGVGIFIWDCLGRARSYYYLFHSRLWMLYGKSGGFKTTYLYRNSIPASVVSIVCTWFTTWSKNVSMSPNCKKNHLLLQTTDFDVVRFFNEYVNGAQFKYRIF